MEQLTQWKRSFSSQQWKITLCARAIKSDQLRRLFYSHKALRRLCFPYVCVGTPKRPHTRLRQSPKWIIPRFGVAPLTPTLILIALWGMCKCCRDLIASIKTTRESVFWKKSTLYVTEVIIYFCLRNISFFLLKYR